MSFCLKSHMQSKAWQSKMQIVCGVWRSPKALGVAHATGAIRVQPAAQVMVSWSERVGEGSM